MSTVGLEVSFEQIVTCVTAVMGVPLAALGSAILWAKSQFEKTSAAKAICDKNYDDLREKYNADKLEMSLKIQGLVTENEVTKRFSPEKIAEAVVAGVAKFLPTHKDEEKKAEH